MPTPEINIIPSHQLDQQKWDTCVQKSSNGLIYAHSIYLNHMADNWHGLVINNYEAVMPIPWRKKWGIRYCYDVPFIQQCGWFGEINIFNYVAAIQQLSRFCKYGNYIFNYRNVQNGTGGELQQQINFIIPLSGSYSLIKKQYKNDLLQNLKKAADAKYVYTPEDISPAIDLYEKIYARRTPHVKPEDYAHFKQLAAELAKTNQAFARKIVNSKGELLATALLLKDGHRIYNIMNSTADRGRKASANHVLINEILKEFAGSNLVFDFEGSDLPGVKQFYQNFGAVDQPYYRLHFNHLPLPVKWLKR